MDSTKRFSNRVEDYVKYRPHYPKEVVAYIRDHYGLAADSIIADIGAGTGISAELFLKEGYRVIAVEPNREMRDKSIALLDQYPGFAAVDGSAENTRLENESMDMVLAGQAFHWFDRAKAKQEFRRILKPGGIVALLWNERLTASDFEKAYDRFIIHHGKDYVQVDHRNISEEDIAAFFSPSPSALSVFPNSQLFDREGLRGRLLSSSYMPARDEDGYAAMVADLDVLFDKYQQGGKITIHYDTKLFAGKL